MNFFEILDNSVIKDHAIKSKEVKKYNEVEKSTSFFNINQQRISFIGKPGRSRSISESIDLVNHSNFISDAS